MNFNLTKPCKDCPFRSDVRPYLTTRRVREIIAGLIGAQATFACHKTTKCDDEGETIETRKTEHCAGALILLERQGKPNQLMRISERLGFYDRTKLDMDAPVYRDPRAMIQAHDRQNRLNQSRRKA